MNVIYDYSLNVVWKCGILQKVAMALQLIPHRVKISEDHVYND